MPGAVRGSFFFFAHARGRFVTRARLTSCCAAAAASARSSTACSTACGPGAAACSSCAASRASASPRCSSTRSAAASGLRVARAVGRRLRDGARVRRPAPAVRADARSPRAAARPAARRARHGVRPDARAPPPDRFLVGLAVLSLLSDVAGERPLVCVVDDAQWLDRASLETLAFVARRLFAESVALIFATREPPRTSSTGLPELVVEGLRDDDARALLSSVVSGPLDERVRDRIVAETRGNPLALLELPRGLTPAELAGGFALPGRAAARAGSRRASGSAWSRCRPTRASSCWPPRPSPSATPTLLWRACARLGIGPDAAAPGGGGGPAEGRLPGDVLPSARALGRLPGARPRPSGGACTARWPRRPIPSSIPTAAPGIARRPPPGPDEDVAAELERSAGRAQARGGLAAAAAFLERAAALTADPARRSRARAGRRAGQARGRRRRRRARAARARRGAARSTTSSARGWTGSARGSRSRSGAAATRRRCCCGRPGGWSRSTRRSRARPTSRRSERRSPPGTARRGRRRLAGRCARRRRRRPPGAAELLLDGQALRAHRRPCGRDARAQAGAAAPSAASRLRGGRVRGLLFACLVAIGCGTTRAGTCSPPATSSSRAMRAR